MIPIKIIRLRMPDDVRKSMEHIVNQLEQHNYVHCKPSDITAVRLFSRFVKPYKEQDKIFVSTKTSSKNIPNVITIHPDFKLVKQNYYIKIVKK